MLAADPHLRCVVCYARISSYGRVKDAHGIEDQHRDMAEAARRLGRSIVYRYTDNDKSASKESVVRDDFEQLLADLTTGTTPKGYPIHGVMAVNDDRLYRRPSDWERYLKAFTSHEERVYHDSNGIQDLYAEGFEIKGLLGVAMSLSETRKKGSGGLGTATGAGRFVASRSRHGAPSVGRTTRSRFARRRPTRSVRP